MNNGDSQPNSQHQSRRRPLNSISQQNQRDADALFNMTGENQNPLEGYRANRDEEAEEDDDLGDQQDDLRPSEDDDVDGDDLEENMEDDYQARPELDQYDEVGIDDQDGQEELSMNQRMEINRRLDQEERMRANMQGRRAAALMDDDYEDDDNEVINNQMRQERMRMMREGGLDGAQVGEGDGADVADILDFDDVQGPLNLWLQKRDVIKWISRQFNNFLRNFKNDGDANRFDYEEKIHEMCQNNKQSLEIVFENLSRKQPTLAIWLAEEPALMLPILNEVAMDITSEVYPDYHRIHDQIFIRVRELPVLDTLRDLRQVHLNALIKIRGVVTKRTTVFPELQKMYFRCNGCQDLKGPLYHNSIEDQKQFLGTCIICQSKGPFHLEENMSIYRNYQKWTIQETPGSVPPGRVPRQKEIYVLNDLIDMARPGDEVEITGIFINRLDYNANVKHGFPVFTTIIEANNIKRFGDEEVIELTDEDKQAIRKLGKLPNIAKKVFDSIAPSIYGHDFIKRGLTLAMFSGVPKDIGGKHRIRGDINMLLLGDPGTAKSQFLKYVEQIVPRVVYTTGKGASAVGLTAGVHRDPVTQEWTLEAGALVLADKGICLIDEFDKMNDQDRTSIHEAMEQQSISISKAGIITSLQARCSVIAAANPLKGTYNTALNFNDNVDLTDPILSRFDLLAVVKDDIDEEYDDALATFVINSHIKNHPVVLQQNQQRENQMLNEEESKQQQEEVENYLKETLLPNNRMNNDNLDLIPHDLLKKYIIYAKRFLRPKLSEIDQDKVTQFYADIRRESNIVGGIPIAVRHIESVIRMSEAWAKMHLRDHVRTDDIDNAIEMLLNSFLQSQKVSVARQLSKKFEKYKAHRTDQTQLLIHTLKKIVNDRAIYERALKGIEETERVHVRFTKDQFEHEVRDLARHGILDFYDTDAFKKDFKLEDEKFIVTKNRI